MYIYMYTHIHIYVYMYMRVCVCVCVCVYEKSTHYIDHFSKLKYMLYLQIILCLTPCSSAEIKGVMYSGFSSSLIGRQPEIMTH